MFTLFRKKCPICKMTKKENEGVSTAKNWFCSKEHQTEWEKLPSCCK